MFTAFPRENDVNLRMFKRTKRALRGRAFHMCFKDILKLCLLCQCGDRRSKFSSRCVAVLLAIKFPLVLADTAVSFIEQQWWEKHQAVIRRYRDPFFGCRYVDNRLVVFSEQIMHQSWLLKL